MQYNIVQHVLREKQLGTSEGFLGFEAQGKPNFSPRKWIDDNGWHIIKVHHFGEPLKELSDTEGMRVCYIYRDLRDVAVSAISKWNYGEKELVAALDDAVEVYNFVCNLRQALMQKYEELSVDLSGGISEIGRFLNIPMSLDEISNLAQVYSIETTIKRTEEMRNRKYFQSRIVLRRIARRIFGVRLAKRAKRALKVGGVYDPDFLWHPDHISKRRGAIGVWRTELDDHLCKMIVTRYGAWLEANGYLDSSEVF